MADSPHLDRVAHALQQRYVRCQRLWRTLHILLAGSCTALLWRVLTLLLALPVPDWLAYGVLCCLGFVAMRLAWRVRSTPLTVLVQADQTLGLQDSLSTAYEYARQHTTHRFLPGLLAAAARYAPQVEARRVFPLRLSRRFWGIPVCLAATYGVAFLPIVPLRFEATAVQEVARTMVREGQRLEQWGRELEEVAKREQLDRSMILARQLQQMGQRLQQQDQERGQVTERLATLSQYLQRLQQELRERALMNDAGTAAAHEVLMAGKSMKQELRDILAMLQNDTSPRETAAMAEQSVLRLSRQLGQHPQLEQLLQNLRTGDLDTARQLLQDALRQQQASEEVEHLDRARRALEYTTRSIQRGGQPDANTGRSRSQAEAPGSTPMDMGDEGMFPESMPGMEDYPMSGAEDGMGSSPLTRQQPSAPLQESEQPASHVEVASGEGARRLSYMRYLPQPNEAQVPVEQAVVQYQQAAEAVLAQEDMPRAYREQIKRYFLSLGMVK